MTEESKAEKPARSLLMRIIAGVWSLLSWLVVLLAAAWAFGALWFDFPDQEIREWMACGFGLVVLLWAFLVRPAWRGKLGIVMAVSLVLIWWLNIQPRQYREWKADVALTANAVIDGDVVTIHNVRNFDYRSEEDFTPHYEMRRYDLRNLKGLDMFINYWGSPYMAHPIASFDFGPDGRVCFSIETRQEKGEAYSAIGGFYRQFELLYVVADERDVIRLRTNFRKGEDVYLYRLNAPLAKQSFLEYVRAVNELRETPRWYNALTNNCTTAIRQQRVAEDRAPWDWRMLVNGFGDELLYERGGLDRTLPFPELKKISHINNRAKAANDTLDFSNKIREGLPGMNLPDTK